MIPLKLAKKVSHCGGCHDDFYNHGGNSTSGCCWALENAKLRWRWVINMQMPMDSRERFRKAKVHDCFRGSGPYRDIFMKRLPQHLGGDWADNRDRLEHELKTAEQQDGI
jgi:hypothetical protein